MILYFENLNKKMRIEIYLLLVMNIKSWKGVFY